MAIGDEYDRGIGQAVHLMQFYMSTLAGYAGMRWDSDNNAEVQDLVECIINAAKQEMAQAMEQAVTAVEQADYLSQIAAQLESQAPRRGQEVAGRRCGMNDGEGLSGFGWFMLLVGIVVVLGFIAVAGSVP